MKAEIKNSVKTRNGGRKTVSKKVVDMKPISMDEFNGKSTKVSSQRPDYKVKPISEEKRVAGKKAMYETANSAMKLAKDVGKGIKNQVIPELKKGLSSPQPNSVKAIANRVKAKASASKPKPQLKAGEAKALRDEFIVPQANSTKATQIKLGGQNTPTKPKKKAGR